MHREFDEEDREYFGIPDDLDEYEDEDDERAVERPLPSLAQMGKDCDWAAERIEQRLAEDPDYPTDKLLAEVRSVVKPLSGYRATDSEMLGLGILAMRAKLADRLRELEKEEEQDEN